MHVTCSYDIAFTAVRERGGGGRERDRQAERQRDGWQKNYE